MRSISEYLYNLPVHWLTSPNSYRKGKRIGIHGIHRIVHDIMSPVKGGFNVQSNIDLDPLVLSDEFQLDEGEDEGSSAFVIAPGQYTMGIINDIHIPFHNLEALRAAINYMRERKVNKILINGDLLDFHGLSRFIKNPSKQFIKDEIEIGRKFFAQLRKLFPTEEIIYKYGNHDSRLSTYIYEKAPALYGLDALKLSELMGLKDYNVKTVAPEQVIQAGKLNIIHGHEFPAGGGVVNVARTMRLKANDNLAMGHFHRTQTDHATSIDGSLYGSYAVGCLCNLKPMWYPMAYTSWNHGMAIVEVESDGSYRFDNRKIIGGRVV